MGSTIANRFGEDAGERVRVKQISQPELGEILDLGRQDNFSLFMPKHRKLAARLINIFLGTKTDLVLFLLYYKCVISFLRCEERR